MARSRLRLRLPHPSLLLPLLGLVAPAALADVPLGGGTLSGHIEAGYQKIAGDTGSSEFGEYRDERQWIGSGRFLLEDWRKRIYVRGSFDDPGQRDERYRLEWGRYGQWGMWGSLSELPHEFSSNATSPYFGIRDANLGLRFTRPAADLDAAVAATLGRQPLGFRTLTGEGGGYFRTPSGLDLRANYRVIDKRGTIQRGGLGTSFSRGAGFADFASPIEERIHEVTTGLSWQREGWNTSFDYTGNLYDNNVGDDLIVASPFASADGFFAGGSSTPSQFRMALAPDNSSHHFTLASSYGLPWDFPARVSATVSYGLRLQDEDFIPQTLNGAIPSAGLLPSQDDLDGKVQTWLGDLRLSARPLPGMHLKLHYRIYDYDNDSDVIRLDSTVSNDTTLDTEDRFSVPNDYTKQSAGAEAAYDVFESATLGLGWSWEQWRRSSDREVSRTNEQGPRLRLDWRPARWAQLRTSYGFTTRRRTGYHPFDYLEETHPDVDSATKLRNVFPELRNFPQADRRRHEANLILTLLVRENLDVHLNGAFDVSDYHRSDYGLTNDETWNVGADVDWRPAPWLSLSAYYSFDQGLARQRARERPVPDFVNALDDPANDWSSRTRDRAHNAGLAAWFELVPNLLQAELSYDFQRGVVRTHSGGPNADAVNWPDIQNSMNSLGTALLWQVDEHLKVKTQYRWERYQQSEFRSDDIAATVGGSILLSPEVDDYSAHIYGVSLIYEF